MGKFVISEEEKKRILNMHQSTKMKPFLFEEASGASESSNLPEDPTPGNPLMIKFYDIENGVRKEDSFMLLDVYNIGIEDFGYRFEYSSPQNATNTVGKERGNGKFYCDKKKAEIFDRDGNTVWSSDETKEKTFSDTVLQYWDNKCNKYAKNTTPQSGEGITTA
jgi:hypothetical protein